MSKARADRDRFARIGAAMAEKKSEQRRDALRTTAAERVASGFLLGAGPRTPGVARALDRRAEQQIGLAEAGRRLGLRRG